MKEKIILCVVASALTTNALQVSKTLRSGTRHVANVCATLQAKMVFTEKFAEKYPIALLAAHVAAQLPANTSQVKDHDFSVKQLVDAQKNMKKIYVQLPNVCPNRYVETEKTTILYDAAQRLMDIRMQYLHRLYADCRKSDKCANKALQEFTKRPFIREKPSVYAPVSADASVPGEGIMWCAAKIPLEVEENLLLPTIHTTLPTQAPSYITALMLKKYRKYADTRVHGTLDNIMWSVHSCEKPLDPKLQCVAMTLQGKLVEQYLQGVDHVQETGIINPDSIGMDMLLALDKAKIRKKTNKPECHIHDPYTKVSLNDTVITTSTTIPKTMLSSAH